MFTKRLVIASLALLFGGWFMSTANAQEVQDLEFTLTTNTITMAEELFGPGNDTALTSVEFEAILEVNNNTGVTNGGNGEITFTLTGGAQFASRRLNDGDLEFDEDEATGGTSGADLMIVRASGGEVGDTSVTYSVETQGSGSDADPDNNHAIEAGDTFTLTIPGLQNLGVLNAGDAIRVEVETESARSATGENFQTGPVAVTAAQAMAGDDALLSVLDRYAVRVAAPNMDDRSVDIDISERTEFVDATDIDVGDDMLQGIVIATVTVAEVSDMAFGLDGTTLFSTSPGDTITLTASGDFNAGARVFVDLDGEGDLDDRELISLTAGLELDAGDTNGGGALVEPMGMTRNVYFVTDGETPLAPGSYAVGMTLDFESDRHKDDSASSAANPVFSVFSGINEDGFAYGVPNCMQPDRARIRITNEGAAPATLFVQGRDEDGSGTELPFTEVDASTVRGSGDPTIAPDETLVLFTQHLEEVFGLNDGNFGLNVLCTQTDTWQGRAQLTFSASENITVTPLVRGSDGQLRDLGGFTGLAVIDGKDRTNITP